MPESISLEIVASGIGESTSERSSDEGPAKLMRPDEGVNLDTNEYPRVTAAVNVETDDGTITGVSTDRFSVYEAGTEREVVSLGHPNEKLDLTFVFDDTGSMSSEIGGAKAGVTDLTDAIDEKDIDARYALVTFKDDVEVDQRFTKRAGRLKSAVNELQARGGGDAPEDNFDAIERALELQWREEATNVIVDITDAPSHYRGDGSGFSEYTLDEVAEDLMKDELTFISVAPNKESPVDSIKTLTSKVDGLWTDIAGLRSGLFRSFSSSETSENFQKVLERITSLLASTYTLTYFSCTPPGEKREVTIEFTHPEYGSASDDARVSVPSRFDLPPECEEETTPTVSRVSDAEKLEEGPTDSPKIAEAEGDDAPDVSLVDDSEPVTDVAILPDATEVAPGDEVELTVRDENGDRVTGATVKTPEQTVQTDERGTCTLEFTEPGEVTVTVSEVSGDRSYGSDSVTISVVER